MLEYATRSLLLRFTNELPRNEQGNIRTSAANRSLSGATFLSHSSKDDDLVVGAIRVLESHGAIVYIDEIDPAMPPYTNKETADLLKSRIRQTKKFVLLASNNSKDSRWVPWELGIADGYKSQENISLFPVSEIEGQDSWASWE